MKWLTIIRNVLTKLTDILLVGREAGLWNTKNVPTGTTRN